MPNNPAVASYVADFLKLDQNHVYRQLTGLREHIDAHVFTHNRENAANFPYHEKWLHELPKPRTRWLRRLIHRQILQQPWPMYRSELRRWLLDLTRIDAQLLHIYFGHVSPQFLPLMKAWTRPVLVSFHGADAGVDMDKPRHRAAMMEVFQHAALLQCRSQALASDLIALGAPAEKVIIQRTGIPMEEWRYVERGVPQEDGAWQLIQSCRFIDKKGLDTTIRAFAIVAQTYPKARLVLVGDGPQKPELLALAQTLGIAASVDFPGFMPCGHLAQHLYQSHIYLHPSRTSADGNREGVPNAMLEAMATGIPVVATLHGGIPEAITDGESGLLVPENDPAALASATLRLLGDAQLRKRIGHGGYEAVERGFTRSAQSQQLIAVYKNLIARRA
jgi:colanic acid/amylovoran biosynthesis glycosyltransferase